MSGTVNSLSAGRSAIVPRSVLIKLAHGLQSGTLAQTDLMADMIGIASSNALPTMAPWGGRDKIVGMNPLAVAIPAAAESPIVLDIAFGATAHCKIRVYHQKGAATASRSTTRPSPASSRRRASAVWMKR